MNEVGGSIARAAVVLDAVAARSTEGGATLAQLASGTSFSKTTTHRVLGALARIDYVHQDPETRVWRLGHRLSALSRAAQRGDLAGIARHAMRRLADATEDTVFLSVPEGPAAVCIARETGRYPIRTLTLEPGARRPLGVGAGALALYCGLPDVARTAANRVNRSWLAEYGVGPRELEAARERATVQGFALNDGVVLAEMTGVGLAVPGPDGRPRAALAVGAITARMTPERLAVTVLPALKDAAGELSARLDVQAQAAA